METITPIAVTMHSGFTLNDEQQIALEAMHEWVKNGTGRFFVLKGSAGTGKTFTCKSLTSEVRGRVCFTAPTNKAVKVLRETLTTDTYKPECCTIYSLLGLMMVANGEVKELKGKSKEDDEKLDLSSYALVVVDEGSMVSKVLMEHIGLAAAEYNVKFLFMGDPAQLPPVGEITSPIWSLDEAGHAALEKVMRHDNQILTLVTKIRQVVDRPAPSVDLRSDNDDKGGVWTMPHAVWEGGVIKRATAGKFHLPTDTKIVAWRNVKVDEYNKLVRGVFYGVEQARVPWIVGDRALYTAPAGDLDDEPMAKTDDEGTVMSVHQVEHPVYPGFAVWRLGITLDTSRVTTAFVLIDTPLNRKVFEDEVAELGAAARTDSRRWKQFWEFKEAFHGVRHAYAITAHRAQGSTYRSVFVDYKDILLNRNRQEAYRCLYVACSRPTTELFLG